MATTTQPRARSRENAKTAPAPEEPPAPARSRLRGPVTVVGVALAGIAGGIAIGAKARPRRRRGILSPSRKQLAQVTRGFAAFTRELNKAGEQAERLGEALD
jgi:hypothetical protein